MIEYIMVVVAFSAGCIANHSARAWAERRARLRQRAAARAELTPMLQSMLKYDARTGNGQTLAELSDELTKYSKHSSEVVHATVLELLHEGVADGSLEESWMDLRSMGVSWAMAVYRLPRAPTSLAD